MVELQTFFELLLFIKNVIIDMAPVLYWPILLLKVTTYLNDSFNFISISSICTQKEHTVVALFPAVKKKQHILLHFGNKKKKLRRLQENP